MHKNEFIQRGILALMANPNAYGHDSNLLRMAPARLIQEAQDMADFVEQEGIAFDALPMEPEEEEDIDILALEEKEKKEIRRALELHDYKLGRVAEAIGVSERTIRRKIAEYGITLNP